MRFWGVMMTLSLALIFQSGCSSKLEKLGLAYSGKFTAERVQLLVDETWTDAEGNRHVDQEVFESVFEMIDEAEIFILLDFFLVNEFFYQPGSGLRNLSQELANPHSASSAHWNVALRVDGGGTAMACEAESALLKISGADAFYPPLVGVNSATKNKLELLTERKIKEKVLALLALLAQAEPGARIDLSMFYLSDRAVIKAFVAAQQRGCKVRVILDPAQDAFGRTKNGVPNRQSAAVLVEAGIALRWADTHGEQCHAKILYVEHADQMATLLLGSCNYTRRNMDNFNCEADLAFTASVNEVNLQKSRAVFDRWWNNSNGQNYTVEYSAFEDPSRVRRWMAWWMETTGMGTF